MKEVFYMKNKPYKSIEKEYYSSLIILALAVTTGYLVLSFLVKGTRIIGYGYVFFVLAYAYLIKLLIDLKKRKI